MIKTSLALAGALVLGFSPELVVARDVADAIMRVGVQSAIAHPEAAALLREYVQRAGLPAPPERRTLDSICVTDLCR